ncbi:MAG: glutathione S-transferase family protein [Sinobacterium sp.]|nr:glutathione S-transferase family protein [Sinobacterium sp.]
MIDLYIPDRAFGLPNISPFCMKLEGFLRVADIPHQIIFENNPAKGPKRKVPFIRDSGMSIGDSEIIIEYLESKFDIDMDGHLSPHQKAIHHSCTRMLEEHLFWALTYSRWDNKDNRDTMIATLLSDVPPPISTFLAWRFKKQILSQLDGHGLGRHNEDEIYKKAGKDIAALSELLGMHEWFGIDYVSKLDLVALSFLSNCLLEEMPSPLAKSIKARPNLVAFVDRAYTMIFPGEYIKERKLPPGHTVQLND